MSRIPQWLFLSLALSACTQSVREVARVDSGESTSAVPSSETEIDPMLLMPADRFVRAVDVENASTPPSGYVLVREYVDSVKTPDGDQYQRVSYGWDYERGVAVERRETMEGHKISESEIPALTMIATDPEMNYAYYLVTHHPDLSAIARRSDARMYGGFSYREPDDPHCNRGARCVHVMISGGIDGEKALGHAIVDLMSRRVVYPFYDGSKSRDQYSKGSQQ
jgi:hypothetical protein